MRYSVLVNEFVQEMDEEKIVKLFPFLKFPSRDDNWRKKADCEQGKTRRLAEWGRSKFIFPFWRDKQLFQLLSRLYEWKLHIFTNH